MPNARLHKKPPLQPAFAGFEHVNRFWDRQRQRYVAKILPGEFYLTQPEESVATTLGSCVAACVWDERLGIGGMNHFMLPNTMQRSDQVQWGNKSVPGDATRYGNYAMEHLINGIFQLGGTRSQLRAKAFGGGKVLRQMTDVGKRNIDFVLQYLSVEGIPLMAHDLGDQFPRKVIFDPKTGRAFVKKIMIQHNDTLLLREKSYEKDLSDQKIEGDVELF